VEAAPIELGTGRFEFAGRRSDGSELVLENIEEVPDTVFGVACGHVAFLRTRPGRDPEARCGITPLLGGQLDLL
jgi:hypothetical protein